MLQTATSPASVSAVLERRPLAALAVFCALHFLLWTLLPALLYRNLPLDLIEALVYGREWQLGYDKLPPLPWWMVEIAYRLVGHDAAYYALAQVTVLVALLAVFATARPLVGALGALAAVLIVDGLHYLNYTAPKFNHDVVQLPLWALAGYAYHRALRTGRPRHWALLGVCVGLAVWAKYFVAVLAAPLALFVLFDRQARQNLRTAGPYVAVAAALAVMAPHLVWLLQNDFLPFSYAEARAAPARGLIDHVWHPLQFALSQLGFLVPALIIAAPLAWPRRAEAGCAASADPYDRRIVALLAFGPLATVLALSAVSGRGTVAMWGYPLFLFLGVWMVLRTRSFDGVTVRRVAALWALVCLGYAVAFVANYAVLPRFDGRYRAVLYPGERLAAELTRRYQAATARPPVYVVGGMWVGGNVAHYSPAQPRVLIDGNPRRAPWIDLADLRRQGAIVVWANGPGDTIPAALRAVAGEAEVQPPFSLPPRLGNANQVEVGWAILRPQNNSSAR